MAKEQVQLSNCSIRIAHSQAVYVYPQMARLETREQASIISMLYGAMVLSVVF